MYFMPYSCIPCSTGIVVEAPSVRKVHVLTVRQRRNLGTNIEAAVMSPKPVIYYRRQHIAAAVDWPC
jgi:hypothetical protein